MTDALAEGSRSPPSRAAWIEMTMIVGKFSISESPPSRAAWIEILTAAASPTAREGRRLHGRRGLKSCYGNYNKQAEMSPPSRAAWIEIMLPSLRLNPIIRRRLHGRRGLKYAITDDALPKGSVAAFTGGVD